MSGPIHEVYLRGNLVDIGRGNYDSKLERKLVTPEGFPNFNDLHHAIVRFQVDFATKETRSERQASREPPEIKELRSSLADLRGPVESAEAKHPELRQVNKETRKALRERIWRIKLDIATSRRLEEQQGQLLKGALW